MPTNDDHAQTPRLEALETALGGPQILRELEQAARRGKLPGLVLGERAAPGLFAIQDFGTPFESKLMGVVRREVVGTERPGASTRIEWSLRLQRRMPVIFLASLVLTVWPGVWLTDSLLRTYFTAYDFATWMWYLPLTVPFVPLGMMTAVRRSRASAAVEAADLVRRVREVLQRAEPDAGGGGQPLSDGSV